MTTSNAWPTFHPSVKRGVANQVAARAEPRTLNLHRANKSLRKSANGSMATVANSARRKKLVQRTRIHLTPTGLLMEGVNKSRRRLFAKIRVSE